MCAVITTLPSLPAAVVPGCTAITSASGSFTGGSADYGICGAALHQQLHLPAGAPHPSELVEEAQRLGYSALALTDECSLAGMARAHIRAGNWN